MDLSISMQVGARLASVKLASLARFGPASWAPDAESLRWGEVVLHNSTIVPQTECRRMVNFDHFSELGRGLGVGGLLLGFQTTFLAAQQFVQLSSPVDEPRKVLFHGDSLEQDSHAFSFVRSHVATSDDQEATPPDPSFSRCSTKEQESEVL